MSRFQSANVIPHFNFTTVIESCQLGTRLQGHQPTPRSIGIAIRPVADCDRPILRFFIPLETMKNADFYIGDRVVPVLSECGTHIKIMRDDEGYRIFPAANHRQCPDFNDAVDGTQYTARFNARITPELIEQYKFEDVCTTFVEPDYIRKGKYIIVPLDDLPIHRITPKNKKINIHKD